MKKIIVFPPTAGRAKRKPCLPAGRNLLRDCFVALLLAMTPITAAHADINTGLVGYWTFDENSGTSARDSSGSGRQGSLVNEPTWTTDRKVGGNALQFDGSNDLVDAASLTATDNQTTVTWSLWIKPTALSPWTSFLSKYQTNNNSNTSWMIGTPLSNSGAGIDEIGVWFHSSSACFSNVNALSIGQWTHAVIVFDGSKTGDSNRLKIYINGKDSGSVYCGHAGSVPGILSTSTARAIIGSTINNNSFTNGILDDVRIYNRALSAQDAAELYNFRSIPDLIAPSVPMNLVSSNIQPTEVTISWASSIDTGGGSLDGYKIYRNGTQVGTSTTTSYTDTTAVASTNYSYTVSSYDDALPISNNSNPSIAVIVRTADADLTPPVISNINVSPFATLATIAWTTNENSDTQIEYGTTFGYGMQTTLDSALTTTHSKMITGLTPSSVYHYRVKSKDGSPAKNLGVSTDQTFTTPVFIGPTANNIVEAGEACDGDTETGLNGLTCTSVAAGFTGGTLKCKADRSGYDVSACVAGGKIINVVNAQGNPSCEAVDVQNAINLAQDGDTVQVPVGTCTWTVPVGVGQYSYVTRTTTSKSIIIKGAGIDQTIIIEDISPAGYALGFNIQTGKPIRVTGFTFDGTKTVDNYASIGIAGAPGQPSFRVDHCKFTNVTERGIIAHSAYGLIDHNIFLRTPVTSTPTLISVIGDVGGENDSWVRPQDQGTAHDVYMEDNTFIHNINANGPFDMYDGARYVFRNNEVYGNHLGHHGFDSAARGIVNFEIYNNKFMNGLPKDSPYFKMYVHVAKSEFVAAEPANGATKVVALISRGVLEELPEDTSRVRLKNVDIARPSELTSPPHVYNRIWGKLNGAFVHDTVFGFRSGSGLLFNNKVTKTSDATSDTGGYDLFVLLRNFRSGDGYITNMGGTIPWNGNPWNGVCDGTVPLRVRMSSRGLGYQVGDVLNIIQTGASGATITVTSVDANGGITGLSTTTIGSGYTSQDDLSTTGGHGARATVSIAMDGNTPGMQGYPCEDQLGRSSNQALSPIYSWNNDYQGKVGGHMVVGGYATFQCQKGTTLVSKVENPGTGNPISWICTGLNGGANQTMYERSYLHIVEGRDYFNGVAKPGYVPYVYPHPLVQLDTLSTPLTAGSGDASGDGKVTMYDAALVLRFTLGSSLTDTQKTAADKNGDGKIDGADVVAIARKAIGL